MESTKRTKQRPYKHAYARKLRQRMTEAEVILWQAVRNRGCADVKFRRQVPIGDFVVDFCAFEVNLVIELDGSIHERKYQKEYDHWKDSCLQDMGYTVLRFTNDQVIDDLPNVLDNIEKEVERLRGCS